MTICNIAGNPLYAVSTVPTGVECVCCIGGEPGPSSYLYTLLCMSTQQRGRAVPVSPSEWRYWIKWLCWILIRLMVVVNVGHIAATYWSHVSGAGETSGPATTSLGRGPGGSWNRSIFCPSVYSPVSQCPPVSSVRSSRQSQDKVRMR